MARWTVTPGTVGNNMTGAVDYDDNGSTWEIKQDITGILEEVKRDKDLLASGKKQMGWRKAFTIPDIVAIELLSKYGMDVHSQLFMHDPDNMKKLKYIIKTEYPELLIST